MDAYATGDTVRLTQSYSDGRGWNRQRLPMTTRFRSMLTCCTEIGWIARAEVLGNGLIYAQANNFPFNDGRFAQAYFVNAPTSDGAYITPAAFPFYFYTSAVGDQAWAGMALAQLYRRTGQSEVSDGGAQRSELDRDEHLQHARTGRIFVRHEHQPVQPVGAVDQRQIDRAQYRHLRVFHHAGGVDAWRKREQRRCHGRAWRSMR